MSFFRAVGLKLIGNNFIKIFKLFCLRYGIFMPHDSKLEIYRHVYECKICKVNGKRIDHIKINACRWHAGTTELLCRW